MKRYLPATLLLLALTNGPQTAAETLRATNLDLVSDPAAPPGSSSHPNAINDSGQVVGVTFSIDGSYPFVWTDGLAARLGDDSASGSALAINSLGTVAGHSDATTTRLSTHAFVFQGGTATDLGTLIPGALPNTTGENNFSFASGINDLGQVVGESHVVFIDDPDSPSITDHAFLFANGTMVDLGVLGEVWPDLPFFSKSSATAINNAGQIVGESNLPLGGERVTHAFLYQNGTMHDLGTLGGNFSSATDINQSGQVVGTAETAGGTTHPFLFTGGTMLDLGLPDGVNFGVATAINDHGHIVGRLDGTGFPFLYIDGTYVDLNQLAAPFLSDGSTPGFVTLDGPADINNNGQIVGDGLFLDAEGNLDRFGFVLSLASAGQLQDVSRLGNPVSTLAAVDVRIFSGTQLVASTSSDARGNITLSGLDLNPDQPYDIELQLGDIVRRYQAVRPADIASGSVHLALPVGLYHRLDQQLTQLEQTGPLVAAYNTTLARNLMAKWNSLEPSNLPVPPLTHADRDRALARLLSATESLNGLYRSAEPLCLDAAKLITNTIISVLAFQRAAASIQAEASKIGNQLGSVGGTQQFVIDFAIKALATSLKVTAVNLQIVFVKSLKEVAPPWATTLVDQSITITITAVMDGFSNKNAWDKNGGGRRALLESIAKSVGEQVGGRVLASAYVTGTQSPLDLAALRAARPEGSGTVAQGYRASQQVVIDASLDKDLALSASSLISDTTKKWGLVADVSQLVGRIPVAQIATVLAQGIRGLNITLVAGAATNDLVEVGDLLLDDAFLAPALAFHPETGAPPAPLNAKSIAKKSKTIPKNATSTPLFPEFSAALSALRSAIESADLNAAITHATTLLDSDPELTARSLASLDCARSLSRLADPRRPALDDAGAQLATAASRLPLARASLYAALAGHAVPEFADLDATDADLLDLITTTADAIAAFESAAASVASSSSGLVAPAVLSVIDHGPDAPALDNRIPPGPFTLHATLTNTGSQPATGVVATLTAIDASAAPLPAWQPVSPTTVDLGTLDPGSVTTVTWDATATDTSPDGQNTAAVYTLTLAADNAPTETTTGGFEIHTPNTSFDDWVNSFTGTASAPAFTDDPDQDGAHSGRERFLGRHPGSPDTSDLELVDGHLRHPRAAAPGSDAAATYLWSLDLENWNPSGTESDGVSVTLEPTVIAGLGNADKTIQITPEVTGGPANLFFRLDVDPLPDSPPPPVPVAPQITSQPTSLFVQSGSPATFSVTVSATEPVLYQWRKDGTDIPGATGSTLTIDPIDDNHAGTYTVRILTPGGTITSDTAQLQIDTGGGC